MHPPPCERVSVGVTSMKTNTLPARDVAFLNALADFLLASGSDRAADAVLSAIEPAHADGHTDDQAFPPQLIHTPRS